ncbi:MAG: nucleotidyltransferase domain-containing protein [Candidatus Cloacimonetes bacterium]|nr:nucleotidyltransferase domain-containing protein [Candidatus Cloacimonadota bacterium]HNZ06784.1 nucleotidyltransferase domain-containing protein [Candidatus Cloacimonadota bacterium]HOH78970.1 nucleotidyltransferase domain-containing protein [Candidatus Cloacimonadota bacterium]HPN40720.1 nucleotidyltransferase domain-containing protein [Candidatus Cloacimonadota bacterium]
MAGIPDRTELIEIINRYVELVSQRIRVESVYLFGSYVDGKPDDYSDIDLLIVSPDFGEDLFEEQVRLMIARRQVDLRIEPHPVPSGELDSNILFAMAGDQMLRVV